MAMQSGPCDEDPIVAFAIAARAWCDFAEHGYAPSMEELDPVSDHLASLVHRALRLPLVEADEDPSPDATIDDAAWQRVYHRFGALPFSYYAVCLDPHSVPDAVLGVADLADDLADVWLDVKRGLALLDAGYRDAAASVWRADFETHWGPHAANAMVAVQAWRTRV